MGTKATPRSLRDCERLAESMLRGRVEPEPRRLLDVIHAVNPTGRELNAAETRRRYSLKSRLQSLLVRRFRDDLVVEPQPGGIVGLRLRSLGGDACHACLSDLEDDARAWLHLQLDLGLPAPPPPSPSEPPARERAGSRREARPGGTAAGRLADAEDLLRAYDYEAAREALDDAFTLSAGAPQAAVPLLGLLVDTLAADADALSLETELSAQSACLPAVRALLAVAAARRADPARALGFLHGLEGPRAADAWILLARGEPDVALAARHLRRAAQLAPSHPEIAALEAGLHRREAELRRPAEELLRLAVQRGEDAEIERLARDLLARWPASQAARRALRELEARRLEERTRALLAESDAARAAGDHAAELRALQAIGQSGATVAGLEARLARAAEDEEEVRARGLAEELRRRREAGERAEALLGFLELAPRPRDLVRHFGWSELATLEALAERCRPREAVEALLDLEEAEHADPERAFTLLGRHERAFAGLPRARELAAAAEGTVRSRRRAAALEQLERARTLAASAAGLEQAEGLLAGIDPKILPEARAAELSALCARLAGMRRQAELAHEVDALTSRGELVCAREVARRALATAPPEARADWQARTDAAESSLRREWRLIDLPLPGGRPPAPDTVLPWHRTPFAPAWLSPDRERVALVCFFGRWGFVRELEPATGRVLRERVLRAPCELRGPQTDWDQRGLVLFEHLQSRRLVLGDREHDVLRWDALEDVLPGDEERLDTFLVPGTSRLWAEIPDRDCVSRDLERRRADRKLVDCSPVIPVLGPGEARVVTDRLGDTTLLLDAQGQRVAKGPPAETLAGAAAHPSGEGVLLLETVEAFKGEPSSANLLALGRRPHGTFSLGEVKCGGLAQVATSLSQRCTFVVHSRSGGRRLLTAVRWNGEALETAWQLEAPAQMRLVQDVHAGEVVALAPCSRGLRLERLGATAPEPFENHEDRMAPRTTPPFIDRRCWMDRADASGEGCSALQEQLCRAPFGEERLKLARELLAAPDCEGDTAADLVAALAWTREYQLGAFIEQCLARFPDHPALAVWQAWRLALEDKWAQVREHLAVRAAPPGRGIACLYWHLRGLADFHLGELEAALRSWREGAGGAQPGCSMLELLAAASALADPESPAPLPPEVAAIDSVVRVARAVARAGACRRRGDWAGARALLDVQEVHRLADRQLNALLAEAWLGDEPRDLFERFRMARALACLVGSHPPVGLPLASAALSPRDEALVVQRAEAWLERFAAGAEDLPDARPRAGPPPA
ncbi:MAG TPA: hypothetical protein VGK67_37575 [Myxococcales bacterium]